MKTYDSIIIGSTAARQWIKEFRNPGDLDIVIKEKPEPKPGVEYHYSPAFDYLLEQNKKYASLDELYTIKLSHSQWDFSWDKTLHDIQIFKANGARVIPEFYDALYRDWQTIHKRKSVNLNVTNEQFFGSNVKRSFDHDLLHKKLAYYDEPMYNKLKLDKSKAWINKAMFNELNFEDKLKTVREEAYVIALERYIVPSGFKHNPNIAYKRALKDIVTNLSKGWFPYFIVENYDALKYMDGHSKFKEFIKQKGEL